MELYKHQIEILEATQNYNKCAYYVDMGLGKTFIGSEKMVQLNAKYNIVVCQKSKISDWLNHFRTHYPSYNAQLYQKNQTVCENSIIIINYDILWRRPELSKLRDFTLLLDESQYIKNSSAERTKFVMRLKPDNVILLSGTPIGGKYEELLTQCNLLGWKISKGKYYNDYIITKKVHIGQPYKIEVVAGYKNIEDLKRNLKMHGAYFMQTEECLSLPDRVETIVNIDNIKEYLVFNRESIVQVENRTLIAETPLTKLLYLRQLSGIYNISKLNACQDLIESTEDRIVIFYNFREEFTRLSILCKQSDKPISYVNGDGTNLKNYETQSNTVTLVQYQSGSTGINLQLANKIIYYSLPLSCEMYMQSMARIRRIGQNRTCFYYYLICKNSIEEKIYETLQQRQDYTLELFNKER